MLKKSARHNTGHFFHTMLLLLALGAGTGCVSSDDTEGQGISHDIPATGDITMVIQFAGTATGDSMPEAVVHLPFTAGGRFHPAEECHDCFQTVFENADSTGKLMMVIIPETEQFSGSRDHLIISLDPGGIPVAVSPDLDSLFLVDSLWEDPVARQQTVLELAVFFKPEIVLQFIEVPLSSSDVTRFWSDHGAENSITAALFVSPDESIPINSRGWGLFTGKGIRSGTLEGLDMPGFIATVRMISGMDWIHGESGYPAMQAFFATESEVQ
ncbi:MAG: hypothetical protein KAH54_09805 [Candidatus Sabulitectum sp.]|nr:hypothetical protein [Candidatus Sabulitectum sp.]